MRSDMLMPESAGLAYGVWMKHNDGDVHTYIMNNAVVIGTNKSFKDKVESSDLALVVGQDEVGLQYATESGEFHFAKVSDEVWKEAILTMLQGLRDRVKVATHEEVK